MIQEYSIIIIIFSITLAVAQCNESTTANSRRHPHVRQRKCPQKTRDCPAGRDPPGGLHHQISSRLRYPGSPAGCFSALRVPPPPDPPLPCPRPRQEARVLRMGEDRPFCQAFLQALGGHLLRHALHPLPLQPP